MMKLGAALHKQLRRKPWVPQDNNLDVHFSF
jgi:hypothetical protein